MQPLLFIKKKEVMEEHQILDEQTDDWLYITKEAKIGLKTAAQWAYFFAILGFIGIGFMVLAGISMGAVFSMMGNEKLGAVYPFSAWLISALYLILAAFYFFPVLYLFRFADKMKAAFRSSDVRVLTDSFINLGRHYKFLGIMVIALFGLYFVIIIVLISSYSFSNL